MLLQLNLGAWLLLFPALAVGQTWDSLTEAQRTAAIADGSVTAADLSNAVNFEKIRSAGDAVFATIVAGWSSAQKQALCGLMLREADVDTFKQLVMKGLDCESFAVNTASVWAAGSRARVIVEVMRSKTDPANWDTSRWMAAFSRFPDGLRRDDIAKIPALMLLELLPSGYIQPMMLRDAAVRRALFVKVKAAVGDVGTWDETKLPLVVMFLSVMEVDDLVKLNPAKLRMILNNLSQVAFMDPTKKAILERLILKGMDISKAHTWLAADIGKMGQYIMRNPNIIKRLNKQALMTALPTIGGHIRNRRDLMMLGRRIRKMTEYMNAATMDQAKMRIIGRLLPVFGRRYIAKLPPTVIASALADIGVAALKRGEARAVIKRLRDGNLLNPSALRASDLATYRSLLVGLSKADWMAIPAPEVVGALAVIDDMKEFPKPLCRIIVQKVKQASSGSLRELAKKAKSLFKLCVRPREIASLAIDDLDLNCDSNSTQKLDISRKTARVIFGKIRQTLGAPSAANKKYTVRCAQRWAQAGMLKGLNVKDIRDLPNDPDILEFASHINGMSMCEMGDSELKEIMNKIAAHLKLDDDKALTALDKDTVAQVGQFFIYLGEDTLELLPNAIKPVVCQSMRMSCIGKRAMNHIERLASFCLRNTIRDDTGKITDRVDSSSRDENDVTNLGILMCGLGARDVRMLTLKALKENLYKMYMCPLSYDIQQALIDRALELDQNFLKTKENLVMAAHVLHMASDAVLNAINKEVLAEAFPEITEQVEWVTHARKWRDESYEYEMEQEARDAIRTKRNKFVRLAMDAAVEAGVNVDTATNARRKKRASKKKGAGLPTCADIQGMGTTIGALSTENITALPEAEFDDCADTLGSVSDWDSEQLDALVAKAKDTWQNDPSKWSGDHVTRGGSIVCGLSEVEISTLPLDTIEVMDSLGDHDTCDMARLVAGFARFLELARNDKADTLTSDDLDSLGHFVCGATKEHIDAITVVAYTDSAEAIGDLDTCGETQLVAFADKAMEAFGSDVTKWNMTLVSTLGCVVAGLIAEDLGKLSNDQISSLESKTITKIPPKNFLGFTVSQLENLSESQANAVTADQQAVLSPEQLAALNKAGAPAKSSSADFIRYSVALVLLPFALIRL